MADEPITQPLAPQPTGEPRSLDDSGETPTASVEGTAAPSIKAPSFEVPSVLSLDPKIAQARESMVQRGLEQIQKFEGQTQKYISEFQQRQPQREALYKEAEQALGRELPAPPPYEKLPTPPDGAVVDRDKFKSFFGIAFIGAMLMGKAAKTDMVDGLNMLASAMTGFQMGAKQKADEDLQQFKAKTEAALNAQRQKLQIYQDIIRANQMNAQRIQQLLSIEAARQGDTAFQYELQKNNHAATMKFIETEITRLNKLIDESRMMYALGQKASEGEANRGLKLYVEQLKDDTRRRMQDSLESFRQMRLQMQSKESMNKAVLAYEKTARQIVNDFDKAIASAGKAPGMTPEVMKSIIESQSETAAMAFTALFQEIQKLTWTDPETGALWTMQLEEEENQNRANLIDPGWWRAKAHGFAGLNKFVPQIGTMPSGPLRPAPPSAEPQGEGWQEIQ
jgi:hypothetical protein